MKNRHRTRDFLMGAVAMTLVMALATPAGAALTGKTIQVLTGVEIFVDGVKMNPTDANGNPVETFIYNGTTYVPLRAVSQSLGKNVNWDGANQRVYIGEAPGEKQYLLDVCPPYQTSGDYNTPATVSMAGTKYAHGFVLGRPDGVDYLSSGSALYNLNGKYSTLDFDIGHIDGRSQGPSTFNIYLDNQLVFSLDVTAEMLPQHCTVPLYNALQMKIESVHNEEVTHSNWPYGGCYALVNVEIY